MAFTRQFLLDHGVPEDSVSAILAERSKTLADYVPKEDVQAQIDAAVKNAAPTAEGIKETDTYKALETEFSNFKAKEEARNSDAFKGVKPKFFDTVYSSINHDEDIAAQLSSLRENFEEYFVAEESKAGGNQSAAQSATATSPRFTKTDSDKQDKKPTEAEVFEAQLNAAFKS